MRGGMVVIGDVAFVGRFVSVDLLLKWKSVCRERSLAFQAHWRPHSWLRRTGFPLVGTTRWFRTGHCLE